MSMADTIFKKLTGGKTAPFSPPPTPPPYAQQGSSYTNKDFVENINFGQGDDFTGYFTDRETQSGTGRNFYQLTGSEEENNKYRIEQQYNKQRAYTDAAFSKGRESLNQQLKSVMSGFSDAENALARSGRAQRQTALDRETTLAGDLAASAGGRGYLKDYYSRSLSADTTRQLMAVDEQLGNTFAGLYTQRGMYEGDVQSRIGSTYFDQASIYQSLLGDQIAANMGAAPTQSQGKDYSGLYNLAGAGINFLAGL